MFFFFEFNSVPKIGVRAENMFKEGSAACETQFARVDRNTYGTDRLNKRLCYSGCCADVFRAMIF